MNAHFPAHKEIFEYRFKAGDGFFYRGHDFTFIRTEQEGYILSRIHDGLHQGFTKVQMMDAFAAPDPIVHYPGKYTKEGVTVGLQEESRTTKLSGKQKSLLLMKRDLCVEVMKLHRAGKIELTDESMEVVLPGLIRKIGAPPVLENRRTTWKGRKKMTRENFDPRPRTVRDWIANYRKTGKLVSLLEDYGNNAGTTRLAPEVEGILHKHVLDWATTDRLHKKTAHSNMSAEIEALNALRSKESKLGTPDIKTFRDRCRKFPPAFRAAARGGVDAASLEYSVTIEGLEPIRPLERTEEDEWNVDLQTLLTIAGVWEKMSDKERAKVPRIRLWMTAIIDVASGAIPAAEVHRKKPSTKTAVAALEMATRDKSDISANLGCSTAWDIYGSPEFHAVDSASWFISDEYRWVVNDLGTTLFLPPTGAASARGTIERFFRTCSSEAFEYFSGRTWGSVEEKGLQDAEKEASVVFEQAREIILRFIIDVYHNTKHNGGETPRDAWKRLKKRYGVLPPPTGHRRRAIFGSSFEATITSSGFTKDGVPYQSNVLQHIRRNITNKVLARVDRLDLGYASVFDGTRWYTIEAKYEEFRGMSGLEWAAIRDRYVQIADERQALSLPTVRKAKDDLRKAGQLARVLARLPDPGFTEEDYGSFERKLSRKFEISPRGPKISLNMDAEWRPSAAYLELMGLEGIVGADRMFDSNAYPAEPTREPELTPIGQVLAVSDEIASLIDPDFDSSFGG